MEADLINDNLDFLCAANYSVVDHSQCAAPNPVGFHPLQIAVGRNLNGVRFGASAFNRNQVLGFTQFLIGYVVLETAY